MIEPDPFSRDKRTLHDFSLSFFISMICHKCGEQLQQKKEEKSNKWTIIGIIVSIITTYYLYKKVLPVFNMNKPLWGIFYFFVCLGAWKIMIVMKKKILTE